MCICFINVEALEENEIIVDKSPLNINNKNTYKGECCCFNHEDLVNIISCIHNVLIVLILCIFFIIREIVLLNDIGSTLLTVSSQRI